MVRGAWPRNYVLWRNGRTMLEARSPLLVLPLSYGRLSALQVNVFLAVEMVETRIRFEGGQRFRLSAEGEAELDAILDAVAAASGVAVVDPDRLHREAARELETVVA